MQARNKLWKGKKRKRTANCSDIKILNPDGSLKKIIRLEDIKKPLLVIDNKDGRDGEKYHAWRSSVLQRDNRTCVLCESTTRIEAHHIIRWIDDIKLRFNQKNGVALCYDCHQKYHNYNREPFPDKITKLLKQYIKFKYQKAKIFKSNEKAPERVVMR
jgi:hypothetical protein